MCTQQFCFSNAFSTITDKEVFLLLAVDRDHDMPEMERSEFADDAESLFATLSVSVVSNHFSPSLSPHPAPLFFSV